MNDSNAPLTPEQITVTRNRRTDAMFVCAYLAVTGIIYLVVIAHDISEYAQGVLTLALGNFIGYLTGMYNFETGTTRSGAQKDATIKSMAESAPVQAAAAVAANVAATAAASSAPPKEPPAIPVPLDVPRKESP